MKDNDALEKEWPWVASLRNETEDNRHFCTAVVIGPKILLTAAHCVIKYVILF